MTDDEYFWQKKRSFFFLAAAHKCMANVNISERSFTPSRFAQSHHKHIAAELISESDLMKRGG